MADNVARGLAMQALGRIPKTTSADAGKLATVDSNGEWTAAELEVGQGEVAVDSTLLVSGAAADAKVTGDKVAELKSAIDDFADEVTETIVTDLTSAVTWSSGYIYNGQWSESSSYKYTTIANLLPGDKIIAYNGLGGSITQRFVDQMNGQIVVQAQVNQNPAIVLEDAMSLVISIAEPYVDGDGFKITKERTQTRYTLDMDSTPTENSKKPVTSEGVYNAILSGVTINPTVVKRVTSFPDTIDAFQSISRGAKLSASIAFTAFTSLQIGMINANNSIDYSVTVDGTNVTYSYGNNSSVSDAHGLTIANNVQLTITSNNAGKICIYLTSNGATYSKTTWEFVNRRVSKPYVNFTGTDGTGSFSFVAEDVAKDIWVFGDSYVSNTTSRWMHYFRQSVYAENIMLCGLSGGKSSDLMASLQTMLNFGKPKYILWCLGMNDGTDTTTASTTWQTAIDELLDICETKGIIPILATIPSVPSFNHEKKNEFVRASGKQYVDFAKAVGATENGTWYTGMLYTDNVHPTEAGAKALYAQAITDCPELCVMN